MFLGAVFYSVTHAKYLLLFDAETCWDGFIYLLTDCGSTIGVDSERWWWMMVHSATDSEAQ